MLVRVESGSREAMITYCCCAPTAPPGNRGEAYEHFRHFWSVVSGVVVICTDGHACGFGYVVVFVVGSRFLLFRLVHSVHRDTLLEGLTCLVSRFFSLIVPKVEEPREIFLTHCCCAKKDGLKNED